MDTTSQYRFDGTIESPPPPPPPKVARPKRLTKAQIESDREWERQINPDPWDCIPATPEETSFRHSAWTKKRTAVRAAMSKNGIGFKRLDRFDCCGSRLTIEYSEEEKRHRVLGSFCHDRHCEPCARSKANIIAKNLRAKLEGGPKRLQCEHCSTMRDLSCEICNGQGFYDAPMAEYRFITLTLKHNDAALGDQIRRLLTCFKKLRSSGCWRKTQDGGSVHLEVKWKPATRRWHPHLHIIAAGKFLDKAELSAAWQHATKDSFVVDIRILRDAKEAAYYVAKYAGKGVNGETWSDPDAAAEWLSASRGVRMCGTWGTWRGYRLTRHEVSAKGWKHVASYMEVLAAARLGKDWAIAILQNIVRSADPEEVRSTYKMDTGDG
jgi:hypothetical protein